MSSPCSCSQKAAYCCRNAVHFCFEKGLSQEESEGWKYFACNYCILCTWCQRKGLCFAMLISAIRIHSKDKAVTLKKYLSPSDCSLATVQAVSPSPQVQRVRFCLSLVQELSHRGVFSPLLLLPVLHTLLSFSFLTVGISVPSLASESNFSPDSLSR